MRKTVAAMKVLAVAVAVALVGAACQKDRPQAAAPVASSVGSPAPTESPSAATVVAAPTVKAVAAKQAPAPQTSMEVTLFTIVAGANRFYLAPEKHRIPYTQAVARAALEELIHGTAQDPDHLVPYSRKAEIRSVSISDGVATVDWSAAVLRDHQAGAEVEALAIQQVVWTLTQFPTISKVRFTVEGRDHGTASNGDDIASWWGHVGLAGQPFSPTAYMDDAEPIVLWTPLQSAASSGSLTLKGEVVAPDGSHRDVVRIVLRDAAGRAVVTTFAYVTYVDPYGSQPWRTTYAKTIKFTPPASPQTWTLSVAIHSLNDDSIEFAETRSIRVG